MLKMTTGWANRGGGAPIWDLCWLAPSPRSPAARPGHEVFRVLDGSVFIKE